MICQICGRDRVWHGSEDGTYLNEFGCQDGVLMDDDEYHEGWQRDVIYPPCPYNPERCKTCKGTGYASPSYKGGDDCPNCRGTGWNGGKTQWPTEIGSVGEGGRGN